MSNKYFFIIYFSKNLLKKDLKLIIKKNHFFNKEFEF